MKITRIFIENNFRYSKLNVSQLRKNQHLESWETVTLVGRRTRTREGLRQTMRHELEPSKAFLGTGIHSEEQTQV